jgi:hypothetical protein
MRAIKVTFRAVFQQPIGKLNPMDVKLPGPHPVEIFGNGDRWQVREIASPRRQKYEKLGHFDSIEHAQAALKDVFSKMLEPWQLWGTVAGDGQNALAVERMLTPYDVVSLSSGKWAALDDEDRTHILHGPLIDPKAKVPNAACGASVNAKCFISTKANVEPTCRPCKEVWEREYKDK